MNSDNCLIIVPVFNESKNIKKVINNIKKSFKNIIVIDDGSNDNSSKIIEELDVLCLRHFINLGQGASIQTAFDFFLANEQFEYAITFDGDGQNRMMDAKNMYKFAVKGKLDAVLGTRFYNKSYSNDIPLIKKITLKIGIIYERIFFGIKLTDAHNGLRVLSKDCIKNFIIPIKNFDMSHATEISYKLTNKKCYIKEFPVKVKYKNKRSQSSLNAINIAINNLFRTF